MTIRFVALSAFSLCFSPASAQWLGGPLGTIPVQLPTGDLQFWESADPFRRTLVGFFFPIDEESGTNFFDCEDGPIYVSEEEVVPSGAQRCEGDSSGLYIVEAPISEIWDSRIISFSGSPFVGTIIATRVSETGFEVLVAREDVTEALASGSLGDVMRVPIESYYIGLGRAWRTSEGLTIIGSPAAYTTLGGQNIDSRNLRLNPNLTEIWTLPPEIMEGSSGADGVFDVIDIREGQRSFPR